MQLPRRKVFKHRRMLLEPHIQTLNISTPIKRDPETLILQTPVSVNQKVFLQRKVIRRLFDPAFHYTPAGSLAPMFVQLMRVDLIIISRHGNLAHHPVDQNITIQRSWVIVRGV